MKMNHSIYDKLEYAVRKCWGVSIWCCSALFLGTGGIMLSEYSNRLLLTGVLTLLSGAAVGITVSFLLVIKVINEFRSMARDSSKHLKESISLKESIPYERQEN
ncbi:hypothetical protein 015DV002_58 [Bacillus phage 015DV002]|nr:hypothetical protein 015DV002_58 [Bacillus phage 015DV002]